MAEALNKTQEKYLQLRLISFMQIEGIPVFEAYLRRSNAFVQMYLQLTHLNIQIGEGPRSSNMFGLDDTGSRLNLVNLHNYHSVAERHPNLVLKFACLKYLDDVDPFNISVSDGVK